MQRAPWLGSRRASLVQLCGRTVTMTWYHAGSNPAFARSSPTGPYRRSRKDRRVCQLDHAQGVRQALGQGPRLRGARGFSSLAQLTGRDPSSTAAIGLRLGNGRFIVQRHSSWTGSSFRLRPNFGAGIPEPWPSSRSTAPQLGTEGSFSATTAAHVTLRTSTESSTTAPKASHLGGSSDRLDRRLRHAPSYPIRAESPSKQCQSACESSCRFGACTGAHLSVSSPNPDEALQDSPQMRLMILPGGGHGCDPCHRSLDAASGCCVPCRQCFASFEVEMLARARFDCGGGMRARPARHPV